MKTIQKYRADDGKIFKSESKCKKYEKILKQVDDFLSNYPNPDKFNISNGSGYILHKSNVYKEFEEKLVKLANDWFDLKEPFKHFNYMLGRYIDDSNMSCLNKLSCRLMCLNGNKEYGQPYYANNPKECKNVQVN